MTKTSSLSCVKQCKNCSADFVKLVQRGKPQVHCSQKCCRDYWTANNPEKDTLAKQKYVQENKDKRAESTRKYQQANKAYYSAYAAFRRALKLQATPPWLTEEQLAAIDEIYKIAQTAGLEVDHIVPLKGKSVRGLHVPWNLQLLSRSENASKFNKLDEDVIAILRKNTNE